MRVYIDRIIVYESVENIVKWPFQNEDNFYSSAFSAIVFIATQRLLNVSYTFSLILTSATFCSIRIYQLLKNTAIEERQERFKENKFLTAQKKELEKKQIENCARIIIEAFEIDKIRKEIIQKREKNIEEMTFFLSKDLLFMRNVFRGCEENKNGEKVNENEFSKQKEKFIELCKYFKLDIKTFSGIWVTWPSVPKQDFLEHCKKRAEFFFSNIQ